MSVDTFLQGYSFIPDKCSRFIRWEPPPPDRVKLNFDGSLQRGMAAGGYVLRDWKGEVLMVGATSYGRTSIIMAEGRALRDGLQAVISGGYRKLEIEGDNMLIIQVIQDRAQIPWQLRNIILEIKGLLNQCFQVMIRHIYREANMAADWLSKYGHSAPFNLLLAECDALEFRTIIQEDWAGRTLVRRGA